MVGIFRTLSSCSRLGLELLNLDQLYTKKYYILSA